MLRSVESPRLGGNTSRACQNCSRAKAKCEPSLGNPHHMCTRCLRLKKECLTLPKKIRKKRSQNVSTNITQLEQKIEGLVTLITSGQGSSYPTPPRANSQVTAEEISTERITNKISGFQASTTDVWPSPAPNITCGDPWNPHTTAVVTTTNTTLPGLPTPPQLNTVPSHSPRPQVLPQNSDPDYLIKIYRLQFELHFPFVDIPLSITSDELQRAKPWLHRSVIMIASQLQRAQQIEMGKSLISDISQAILLRGEKSLDMVQCLLLYNAWSYFYCPVSPATQSTGILYLMFALLFDLNLTKTVRDMNDPAEVLADVHAGEARLQQSKRTLEERRTFLACFLISSISAQCMRKVESLRNTPYIENCCRAILEESEREGDILLVHLVRLHAMSESTAKFLSSRKPNSGEDDGSSGAPVWMHVKAALADLKALWDDIPTKMQENHLLKVSHYGIQIFISKHSLSRASSSSQTQSPLPPPTKTDPHRLDTLYTCLLSCKYLLDAFLSLPLCYYAAYSVVSLGHMGHAFATLLKLSILEEPGWDLRHVQSIISFISYFDRMSSCWEKAGEKMDLSMEKEGVEREGGGWASFAKGCADENRRAMGRVRRFFEMRIRGVGEREAIRVCEEEREREREKEERERREREMEVGDGDLVGMDGGAAGVQGTGMVDAVLWEDFKFLDEAYWLELMGDCGGFVP